MTIRACVLALLALLSSPVAAQKFGPESFRLDPIAAPPQPAAVPLYPDDALPKAGVTESWGVVTGQVSPAVTIRQRIVRNIVRPTITPFLPDPAKATGAAMVVAPGGAFLSLSIDSEGYDVARWLADHGIAAFVLQYRLNETPADNIAFMRVVGERMGAAMGTDHPPIIQEPRATEDALQALRLIRSRAAEWRVDPRRVGMIGFSAGAQTTMSAALAADAAARPAFIGYIYGPMTALTVPKDAPPMFAALAVDDQLFGRQGFGIVDAWRSAGRPVELHAYERGDHGFGMGRPGTTTTGLMPQFLAWLEADGVLTRGVR